MKADKQRDLQLQFSMCLLLTDGSGEKKLYNFDISQITTVDSAHIGVATFGVKNALIRASNAMALIEKEVTPMATNGKLHLEQVGPHLYDLYTRNGILLCRVFMGNDGQYIKDAAALQEIGKALVKRWGL